MDIPRDPVWQTVAVVVGPVVALAAFVSYILNKTYTWKVKAGTIATVMALTILIGASLTFLIHASQLPTSINRPTPTHSRTHTPSQVLAAYCNAYSNKDYDTAWNLESSNMQKQGSSEGASATWWSTITSCMVKNVDDKAAFSTLTIKDTYTPILGFGGNGDYQFTMIVENGVWKINSYCQFVEGLSCATPQ